MKKKWFISWISAFCRENETACPKIELAGDLRLVAILIRNRHIIRSDCTGHTPNSRRIKHLHLQILQL